MCCLLSQALQVRGRKTGVCSTQFLCTQIFVWVSMLCPGSDVLSALTGSSGERQEDVCVCVRVCVGGGGGACVCVRVCAG